MAFSDFNSSRGTAQQKPDLRDLSLFTLDELLDLRQEVDALIPQKSLKDLNMEQELVAQLQIVKKLQKDVLTDESIPANQRSQCSSAVAAVLATLSKLQDSTYDSERLKWIETTLIEQINMLPKKAQEAFMNAYTAKLDKPRG